MKRAASWLIVIAILLSGCAARGGSKVNSGGSGSGAPNPGSASSAGGSANMTLGPPSKTYRLKGSITAGVGNAAEVAGTGFADLRLPFKIGSDARAVFANLTFSSPNNLQDLDVAIATAPGITCVVGYAVCPDRVKSGLGLDNVNGWFRNGGGNPGSPDSPSRIKVESADIAKFCAAEECGWTAWVQNHGPIGASVTYELQVDVIGHVPRDA